MNLQSIVNTGIRVTSSDPTKPIKVDLKLGENIIKSKPINISSSRIGSVTVSELMYNIYMLFSDYITGSYSVLSVEKKVNDTDTVTLSGTSLVDANAEGCKIVVEIVPIADRLSQQSWNDLEASGMRKSPDEFISAGGWIEPHLTAGPFGPIGGSLNSSLVRNHMFRSIQSSLAKIVEYGADPKKYRINITHHADQTVSAQTLQTVFGDAWQSAIDVLSNKFGCTCKIGVDGIVVLPPPFVWSSNSTAPAFVTESGVVYSSKYDGSDCSISGTLTQGPTTLGWVSSNSKNFLELTHDSSDLYVSGSSAKSDLGLLELGISAVYATESDDIGAILDRYNEYVVIATPDETTMVNCVWDGNDISVTTKSGETNTYTFDNVVKWFGVTGVGKSTHDTYGYGATSGRTNAAITATRLKTLLGLSSDMSDDELCAIFPCHYAPHPVRISPSGYVVLPPYCYWLDVNTNTAASQLSYKDDVNDKTVVWDTTSGSFVE